MIAWLLASAWAAGVEVVVLDPEGAPVEGARLSLDGEALGATDRRGRAALDVDAAGLLSVRAPGYREVLQGIDPERRRPLRIAASAPNLNAVDVLNLCCNI